MLYIREQQMKPEKDSKKLLSITQSKAKMLEYNIPEEYQDIKFSTNPQKLFLLTIGLLGDYSHRFILINDINDDELHDLKNNLKFSSRFFDAYTQSELDTTLDDYLILLGSATYYLCDSPGNSSVLINKLKNEQLNLNAYGLENLLLWVLRDNLSKTYIDNNIYSSHTLLIVNNFVRYRQEGIKEDFLFHILNDFRKMIYEDGIPRCILFVDVISAIIKLKIKNSCWNTLPKYSGLSVDVWKNIIQKKNFIKEFWPAQHLIGEKGVLQGKSAVIQMPTSAGKTKASELIIRSAFLHESTSMAIIIAPFRALCHEISNNLSRAFKNENIYISELTDNNQMDFATEQLQGHKQILIVTPEKLFYILNHNNEIALLSNLYIFDEGHQFDNGTRGVTYELLLTTLLLLLPDYTQKILISAVINNTTQISNWLNGNENIVVGTGLLQTFRTVGFVSWSQYKLGQIYFIGENNTEEIEYYVPRVIEQVEFPLRGREQINRVFPSKDDGNSISLYLGLKLVTNGSVAIFCGKIDSVTNICGKLLDIIDRKYPINLETLIPDNQEVERLAYLYITNMGEDSIVSKSAKQGVFSHHNNIPHGIRIAVEYAMRENKIHFVICTSTLAQGVNLPIRYLIIPNYYQGKEIIKTRDFHNLIGRVGRAGMHTEGSIIFSNPEIFDNKEYSNNTWRWDKVQALLNPENSEQCSSELLTIFEPFKSDDGKLIIRLPIISFVTHYLDNPNIVDELIENILNKNPETTFTKESLENQFSKKIKLISAIENFMLSNWEELEALKGDEEYSNIVSKTLGYSLADDEIKENLRNLFNSIEDNIRTRITDSEKRKLYGKTLYGINDAISIETWFTNNILLLLSITDEESLLNLVWDILKETYVNKTNLKVINIDSFIIVIKSWISGTSYNDLLSVFKNNDMKKRWGKKSTEIKIEDVVDFCDNKIVFDGCMVLSAIYEFAAQDTETNKFLMSLLQKLQRRLKYGLPDETSIIMYELGFCDRVIAQDMKNILELISDSISEIKHTIRIKKDLAINCISKYPAYYQMKMNNLLNQ